MFTTIRSTTMPSIPSVRPAPAQTAQKKYYADGSFRVFRAPVISSVPYTTTAKLDPGYHSTRSDNRHWHNPSPYHDVSSGRTPTLDDRARTPRYFTNSEQNPGNRKPATDYFISSRFPLDDAIYNPLISDIYSADYDEYYSMNTTPTSTYSLVVSEDTSLTMSDAPDLGSDYSRPTTPVDIGNRPVPMSSTPTSSPQQNTSHSSSFRNRADSGYTTPQLNVPESDPSFRSGSNDNARFPTDSRRHPVFQQTRPGNVAPATVTNTSAAASGGGSGAVVGPPYAESVLSVESEDDVHKLAKVNASYNAATSAFYGALGRESQSIPGQEYGAVPGVVPSVTRILAPVATPRQSEGQQTYTDAPLTSSPTPIRYTDELYRSTSYRDNGSRRSPDGKDNNIAGVPAYGSSSAHRANAPRTAVPPRYTEDFLPPLNEWDESRVPPTPGNSPQSPFTFQGEQSNPSSRSSRWSGEREPDTTHSRPLPIPPRSYTSSEGSTHPEKVIVTHYVQRSPEGVTKREVIPEDRRRERGGSASIQVEPLRSQGTAAGAHYSSDEYDTAGLTKSSSSRRSKDGRRSAAAEDFKRTSSSSPPHDHEPRLIPKVEGSAMPTRQAPSRRNSISFVPATPAEDSRPRSGRSSRDAIDPNAGDREGSGRTKKSSSSYDRLDRSGSLREERTADKPKSSRHGYNTQDRVPYILTTQPQNHSSSRIPIQTPTSTEAPFNFERRRKDSTAQPIPSSEIPVTITVPPSLVPLARPTAPSQSEQILRSYSRSAQATSTAAAAATTTTTTAAAATTTTTPADPQGIYQRSHRRLTDDPRPSSNNNSHTSRREHDSAVQVAPEPHRRYSDGDVPQPHPFLPTDAGVARSLPQSSMYARRCVRWNDNLICPSPVLSSQRREGWFNRRGDQLWTNDGIYMPAPAGQEYPPDLDDYPEYGDGWMNEKGVRIDMGHRLIPKTPLRPALKQTQARS